MTVSRELSQLADRAELIVHGTVTSVKVEPHPDLKNLTTVLVILNVAETIKGRPQRTLEFRQYVWDARSIRTAAGYQKGEELLLLLNPVSRYGLTSPTGMEQGRFRIVRDSTGTSMAVNGRNNAGLFNGTAVEARRRELTFSSHTATTMRTTGGPILLTDLIEILRGFSHAK